MDITKNSGHGDTARHRLRRGSWRDRPGESRQGLRRRRPLRATAVVVITAVLLTGCGGQSRGQDSAGSSAAATAVDISLNNCGTKLHVDRAPQRVVTIKSTALELLLALGLSDRIVGSAYMDGDVPAGAAPAGWKPNVIAKELPGKETMLGLNPDFVFAGWESNFAADGIGNRADLQKLGVDTYVAPPACTFGKDQGQQSFDDIFRMYKEVGQLFGVTDAAKKLVDEQRADLEKISPARTKKAGGKKPTALWFSSGADTPFVGGGAGTPQLIMDTAGVRNMAGKEKRSWYSMPWEKFVSADPDVIVLVDAPWNTAKQKREKLESHPAAAKMTAVKHKRYVEVPFAATEPGVRSVDAAQSLADRVPQLVNR